MPQATDRSPPPAELRAGIFMGPEFGTVARADLVAAARMNADLHMADELKTTLKAEIDEEAWGSLYSYVSRPLEKPSTGRIAVKVINHLGDEVMKVFDVL